MHKMERHSVLERTGEMVYVMFNFVMSNISQHFKNGLTICGRLFFLFHFEGSSTTCSLKYVHVKHNLCDSAAFRQREMQ